MTPLPWIALACAVGYLALTARPAGVLRSVVKTTAVAALAVAAVLAQAPVMLAVALALCALGDLLLSRDGDAAFMGGIAAFAAGHLAYIALFLLHPLADIGRIGDVPQVWVAAGLVLLGVVMARLLAPRAGSLRGPVLGYIPIILGMGVAVLALPETGPGPGWALVAAFAFVASDMVLASEKFLLTEGHPALRWTPYVVWPLYWGAQAGFFAVFA
ncbi:MAG: putative membrane protein YhhN [Paracoccaceae bacterium]